MKSIIKSAVAVGLLVVLPIIAFAQTSPDQTYEYVNTSGNTEFVVSDNATDATALATDISPTSGVMVVSPGVTSVETDNSSAQTFEYVNVDGSVESEAADNAADALTLPRDIAPTSGVMTVTPVAFIPSNVHVSV